MPGNFVNGVQYFLIPYTLLSDFFHKRFIKQAFQYYLNPHVIDRIIFPN